MLQLIVSLVFAASLWFLMFSSQFELTRSIHNQYFWQAMVVSTLSLTLLTLRLQRQSLKQLFAFEWKFVGIGAVHAVLLYGLSRLGVWLMSTMFDWTRLHIEAVYATRLQLDPFYIAPLLFFIIAPCEEIFWRGFVQARFAERFSAQRAMLITAVLYSLVHIWAMNPMLLIAALVLGVHWGFLYRRYGSLIPGIVSHALWDTTIFVLFPVQFT